MATVIAADTPHTQELGIVGEECEVLRLLQVVEAPDGGVHILWPEDIQTAMVALSRPGADPYPVSAFHLASLLGRARGIVLGQAAFLVDHGQDSTDVDTLLRVVNELEVWLGEGQ